MKTKIVQDSRYVAKVNHSQTKKKIVATFDAFASNNDDQAVEEAFLGAAAIAWHPYLLSLKRDALINQSFLNDTDALPITIPELRFFLLFFLCKINESYVYIIATNSKT